MLRPSSRTLVTVVVGFLLLADGAAVAGVAGAGASLADQPTAADRPVAVDRPTGGGVADVAPPNYTQSNVSEPRYVRKAPEKGDKYYEAAAADGSWISYKNPRDRYRTPYLGDASGKICITLRNEAGQVVIGESVPNTTVKIPTGENLEWHSFMDPMTVKFPMHEHHEFPLDGDQFGTSSDLPQGDGYMDSHCVEFHGPDENASISYGEVQIEGEHADEIEVVGYIQHANSAWETDIDAMEAAESYEEAGGGWKNRPGGSHGQVVVVLQLNATETGSRPLEDAEGDYFADEGNDTPGANITSMANDTETATDDGENGSENGTTVTSTEAPAQDPPTGSDDGTTVDPNESVPGFGTLAAMLALAVALLARARR